MKHVPTNFSVNFTLTLFTKHYAEEGRKLLKTELMNHNENYTPQTMHNSPRARK